MSGLCKDCRWWQMNGYESGWGACDHPRLDGHWLFEGERPADQIAEAYTLMNDEAKDVVLTAREGWDAKCHAEGDWQPPPDIFNGFQSRPDFGCVLFEQREDGE